MVSCFVLVNIYRLLLGEEVRGQMGLLLHMVFNGVYLWLYDVSMSIVSINNLLDT